MTYLSEFFYYLTDIVLVSGFGWLGFLIILVYMLWWLRRDKLRDKYGNSIKQLFLEVRIDELNEKSPLAMEQIFAALHAIHTNFTWGEDSNGKLVLWVSCEIVSMGGKVSYVFRVPERYRNLFESAVFAQYPKAEIHEVEDYLKNLPHHYVPEEADFEFWGSQWNKKKESAYPIRTYAQDASFEHSSQDTFIDPLANLIEAMSNMQPHELLVWQVCIKPVNDDWKKHVKHLVDELKGVPAKHSESILWNIATFIPDFLADILVTDVLGVEKGDGHDQKKQEEPPSLMLHRTDVEKMVITAIEHGLSKVSYETRVRGFYLAPKDKFNKSRITEIVGAVRNFDDLNLNGLKPDIGHTWTEGPAYKLSEKLEKPYLEMAKLTRKRHFLHAFVPRSVWKGSGKMFLNAEELATIFHFPQIPLARVSQLERTTAVKAAPPMDLPVL